MLAERAPETSAPSGGNEWDQKEMPFTEHLRELRNRLFVSVVTVGALALVLFWPSGAAILWLKNEYLGANIQLHAFSPTDVIGTEFKFSIYGAVVLGLPMLVYQVWMFIVPAFHPRTRRIVYAYVAPSIALAAVGILFCHFFIGVEPTLNVILLTFLAFAVVFQTPVIMVALARIGLVNVPMLRKNRRYAGMGILLFGGIAAPDASPVTMMLIAGPMYALYEGSIWIILALERTWKREANAA